MSQRTRVKKLEETGGSKLAILVPMFEDAAGETVTSARLPDDVAVAQIHGHDFCMEREPDEEPGAFERRVWTVVRERFEPCLLVRHWAVLS